MFSIRQISLTLLLIESILLLIPSIVGFLNRSHAPRGNADLDALASRIAGTVHTVFPRRNVGTMLNKLFYF